MGKQISYMNGGVHTFNLASRVCAPASVCLCVHVYVCVCVCVCVCLYAFYTLY